MCHEPVVRRAEAADAEAVAGIYTQSILARDSTMDTEPVDADTVRAWLDRLSSRETLLVVEVDGSIRGWGIVRRYSERPGYALTCETSVYLDRAWVGRGLGSRVQAVLMDHCRASGFHHVVAKIWADNAHSAALHRKFGFNLVGVQREAGRVDDRWRDVAIYQCLLEGPAERVSDTARA